MSVSSSTITPTVGLEITGMTSVDLAEPAATGDALHALDRYGVVVYREVDISDDDLLGLTRRLGTPVGSVSVGCAAQRDQTPVAVDI